MIPEFLIGAVCLGVLGLRLLLERRAVSRWRGASELRIVVTGTRGKSTVTRLIAGALRAAGLTVLAKTTGSRPVIILPDGEEREVDRPGPASILEQKDLLKLAAGLGVRAVVSELMAVRPEVLAVESRRLFQPQAVVITNVRVDHREEQGGTRSRTAASLSSAIAPGSTVYVPDREFQPEFEREARRLGATLVRVGPTPALSAPPDGGLGDGRLAAFPEDLDLALAMTDRLGIPRETALRGMAAARPDFGVLKAWEADLGRPAAHWTLVSAFAANDPESTRRALDRLDAVRTAPPRELVGVLNLRADRGDRTRQWIEALDNGFFAGFAALYIIGAHVRARRWRRPAARPPLLRPLEARAPEPVMAALVGAHRAGAVVVGLGNMGGSGGALVEHWERIGRPHAL